MGQVSPFATVTLDGSGNGQVAIGPPPGTVWALDLATLNVAPAPGQAATINQPQGFLYRGSAQGPLELVDTTYTGAQASSGKAGGAPYFSGQMLWAKWTGGDAGAVATLRAFGTQMLRDEFPLAGAGAVGEGFDNPIVAGTHLLIPAIQSPNFVAGATGWSINRDGSAEFSDVVVRGGLEVGSGPDLSIDDVVPADLAAFYAGLGVGQAGVITALMRFRQSSGTYTYIALVDATAGTSYFEIGTRESVSAAFGRALQIRPTANPNAPAQMTFLTQNRFYGEGFSDGYTYSSSILYTANDFWSPATLPDCRLVKYRGVAGGGGGGGCALTAAGQSAVGGGGGGGQAVRGEFLVANIVGTGVAIDVGAAGTAGAAGANNGGDGGDSFLTDGSGTIVLANGGTHGDGGTAGAGTGITAGGAGGTGGTGDVLYSGGHGVNGIRGPGAVAMQSIGGDAGDGWGGITRAGATDAGAAGLAGRQYGGGGSGAHNQASQGTGKAGGAGFKGAWIFDFYV